MATKKKASKKRGGVTLDVGSDPPILVGGGGSSLIWVDFNQNQTTIPPGSAGNAPSPTTPSKYSLSKILNQPAKLFFNNGTTPGKSPRGRDQVFPERRLQLSRVSRPWVKRPAWLFSARASVSSHSAISSKPSSRAVFENPGYISVYS